MRRLLLAALLLALPAAAQWQRIDKTWSRVDGYNPNVLSGTGTAGRFSLWNGTTTVTSDAGATFSGTGATFAAGFQNVSLLASTSVIKLYGAAAGDTGLSTSGAGVVFVGNGTAGNATGSIVGDSLKGRAFQAWAATGATGDLKVSASGPANVIAAASDTALVWNNGTSLSSYSADTGLSRAAAGTVAVGNGTAGDYSGTLRAKVWLPDGTGSAPALRFTTGTQTGLYENTDSSVAFTANAVPAVLFEYNGTVVRGAGWLGWTTNDGDWVGGRKTVMTSPAAATVQLGAAAANADGVDQTLQTQGGITGTDRAAGDLTLRTGVGTGAGKSLVRVQTPSHLASGTTAQTQGDRVVWTNAWTTLTETTATPIATVTYGASSAVSAEFFITIKANDATDFQSLTSRVRLSSVRKATGNTVSSVALVGTDVLAESNGASTLTVTYTVTEGASGVVLNANATSSLTQTVLAANLQAVANGSAVTISVP